MDILNTFSLDCNKKLKLNFNGGELSSDAGMFLLGEFAHKIHLEKIISDYFKTNDSTVRKHTDTQNALQKIYQCIAGYFQDDVSDDLKTDPVFTALLNKKSLASQPTLSRFFNRCDDICLMQFELIQQELRRMIYSIKKPEQILIDIDSTLFSAYGAQEGKSFNAHYREQGFHPLLAYDGLTGDLLKAQLRPGSAYTSKGAHTFLKPLLLEFLHDYPEIPIYLRGDSGFADVILYETLESNGVSYTIRLKENGKLRKLAYDIEDKLSEQTKENQIDYAVCYGEFMYKADSWLYPRRVVCKIEKPENQMIYLYTFLVTNMDGIPQDLVRFYCKRGSMENFIKESKSGFHMDAMSSTNMIVNENKLQLSMLAYNLFNWFRRLVLPKAFQKLRVDTIRLKLLKTAAKAVHSARYITFKLCSSCPYKEIFAKTLNNIQRLSPQLN